MTVFNLRAPTSRLGFSLVEFLVVLAILALLAALSLASINRVLSRAREADCFSKMHGLGAAIAQYRADNQGMFPRSFHSAGAHREPGWATAILPYLAPSAEEMTPALFNKYFRCPEHKETNPLVYSYAMNVHFELDPEGDDYVGSPQTWRRDVNVPSPSKTILLAEPRPVLFGDHLMCHQWSSTNAARNALAYNRHRGKSHFLFVDGHVERLGVTETFDPRRGVNLWNPSLAR
jgi:prepilin-type N-terminal cleavage/methylation domain-containing protein/prepilin-type processing-associated H-X9-DG protein